MTASLLGAAPIGCCSKRRPAHLPSSSTSTGASYHLNGLGTRLDIPFCSPWKGLNHLCISFRRNFTHLEKKGKSNRMAVHASLFGVGAPEVLVIGVVALLVFGPKGLAEVARNLGKTLRSFQPTIRELQEVSREFKSTFEREIGLDEVSSAYRSNSRMNQSQQEVSDSKRRPTPAPEEKLTMKTEPEPEEKLTMKTEPETEEKLTMKTEPEPQEKLTMKTEPEPEEKLTMKTAPEPEEKLTMKSEELAATTKSQTDSSEEKP